MTASLKFLLTRQSERIALLEACLRACLREPGASHDDRGDAVVAEMLGQLERFWARREKDEEERMRVVTGVALRCARAMDAMESRMEARETGGEARQELQRLRDEVYERLFALMREGDPGANAAGDGLGVN